MNTMLYVQKEVSAKEIKKTFFKMTSGKGPDGFSIGFFKKDLANNWGGCHRAIKSFFLDN